MKGISRHQAQVISALVRRARHLYCTKSPVCRLRSSDPKAPPCPRFGTADPMKEKVLPEDALSLKFGVSDIKAVCRSPIEINCPNGASVPCNLELQMSSFAGYESAETSTYLGTQCHGVMWPETANLPAAWPICPPIVSGKVSCPAHCRQ